MNVTVRLFAILRQRAGSDTLELELPEGARVSDALAQVDHLAGGLKLVMAVNREYAAADQRLEAGDELALRTRSRSTRSPRACATRAPARSSRSRA